MTTTKAGLAVMFCVAMAVQAAAQQTTVSTPLQNLSDGFYEHSGVQWGLRGNGWNLSFGGPNNAAPQFGGFDPSSGLNFGMAGQRNGVSGYLGGNFSQGYRQSFTSQTPMVTLSNGMPGFVSDTSVSPFVIGYVPVVGDFPVLGQYNPVRMPPDSAASYVNPSVAGALQRVRAGKSAAPDRDVGDLQAGDGPGAKANDLALLGNAPAKVPGVQKTPTASKPALQDGSSATRPAPSVAEAKRMFAQEKSGGSPEVAERLERARHAEASGKANVARLYYQEAYRRADGPIKQQIRDKLAELGQAPSD